MGSNNCNRIVFVLMLLATASRAQQTVEHPQQPDRAFQSAELNPSYGKLPLIFEVNRGQALPHVKFLARGRGYSAFLTADGMVLSLRPAAIAATATPASGVKSQQGAENTTIQFRLVGAIRNAPVVGEDQQIGRVNYFIGNDPAKWQTKVPTYSRVRYKNIYPGIDLLYYGNHRQLEYDFAVSAGADPGRIQFEISGARQIRVDGEGNLVLQTSAGNLSFQAPAVYQKSGPARVPVHGAYVLMDSTHVAFDVKRYDASKPLVIDPVLLYSTYLGGSGTDQPTGIAVDSTGSVYIGGYTDSSDFPLATLGSLPVGGPHVFVAKFDSTGSNLVYADYVGGNSQDYGYALALNSANELYVTGSTTSSDFPMVKPYQGSYPGSFNGFLTKISADGSSLLYSTYLGGNSSDRPSSIAVDSVGSAVVGGNTFSTNFPVANAYQTTVSPNQDGLYGNYGFLTKFSPDGSSLIYSTYFSGSSNVAQNCGYPCWPSPYSTITGIALDSNGNSYVTGVTNTYDFPTTPGAYLLTNSTTQDNIVGFVSKFNSSGNLDYSTYFYESSGAITNLNAIAVDGSGSAYITGSALSDGTFPITSTSICDPSVSGSGCSYAFVTKFDPTGSTLLYSTFLGPNNYANPVAIALDANNDAYVVASTSSSSFGMTGGIEPYSGGSDVLLVEIDPAANSQLFATYLGGSEDDGPAGIALDSNGNAYVVGSTDSTDFPITPGAFQSILGGNTDAFVVKLGPAAAPSVLLTPDSLSFDAQQIGATSQPQTATLRNVGSAALTVSSITISSDFAQTNNCGTAVPAAGICTFSVMFTPTVAGTRNGSMQIQDDAAGSPHAISLSGVGSGSGGNLLPASLVFSSVPVGTASASQTATLTNSGNSSLNISDVQITGDFAQTNNCPTALPSGFSCTVGVTFHPSVSGIRTGTLTISDNVAGGSQTVNITGNGADFTLSSSSGSTTIKAGSTATYIVTVAPQGGAFNNRVKLSCSGSPKNATCSLSPNSLMPGPNPASATLTIVTAGTTAQVTPPLHSRGRLFLAFSLPGFGFLAMFLTSFRSHARRIRLLGLLTGITLLLLLSACAGGTGIVNQPGSGTPPGTYTVAVTGISGTLQRTLPLTVTVQ